MMIVVAAIISAEGRVLACQRRKGGHLELKWEFPGGKVKEGESLKEALARELREELACDCQIGEEVYRTRFHYAEIPAELELVFFAASAAPNRMKNVVFERIQWVAPEHLPALDFLPADRELVALLASGKLTLREAAEGAGD